MYNKTIKLANWYIFLLLKPNLIIFLLFFKIQNIGHTNVKRNLF